MMILCFKLILFTTVVLGINNNATDGGPLLLKKLFNFPEKYDAYGTLYVCDCYFKVDLTLKFCIYRPKVRISRSLKV
jgi:hypothetical protein